MDLYFLITTKDATSIIATTMSANGHSDQIYLVMHVKRPTYSMYCPDNVCSELINTVNTMVIGVYKSRHKANEAAREYFFKTLEYQDSGESDEDDYYFGAVENGGGRGTWDEEVYVQPHGLLED